MRSSIQPLAIVAVGLAVVADGAWHVWLTGSRLVDEDTAIYWYAAREFARFRFREPFFYGQAYNHLGEALVAAPLVAAGVPLWWALPVVSMLICLATWAVLARIAWMRGAPGLALVISGAPILLPAGYAILQQRFFGMGLLLVAIGLALLQSVASSSRTILAGLLVGLGVLLVPNAAILAAVGLAWIWARPGARPGWRWFLLGTTAGILLHGAGRLFYVVHPDWVLHPAPTLAWRWELLTEGLAELPRHMARVTPQVVAHPGVMLGIVVVVAAWAGWRRRWGAALPSMVLVLASVAALALEKVHEGTTSVFFAYERMFLGIPPAVALVAIAVVDSDLFPRGRSVRAVALAAVAILVAVGWRWTNLERAVAVEQADRRTPLDLGGVAGAREACRQAESAARAEGTDVIVFLAHRTLAYSCGALAYDRVTTIYPLYERRTWILRAEAARMRTLFVVPDVDAESFCAGVRRLLPDASCGGGPAGSVVVRAQPLSTIDFARVLGVPVWRR